MKRRDELLVRWVIRSSCLVGLICGLLLPVSAERWTVGDVTASISFVIVSFYFYRKLVVPLEGALARKLVDLRNSVGKW